MKTKRTTLEPALITPELLRDAPAKAFEKCPKWASAIALAAPETIPLTGGGADVLPSDQNVCVIRAGHGSKAGQFYLDVFSACVAIELTRFGNSVAVNTNREAGAANAQWYFKLTFANATEDNMPFARIVTDALPFEEVRGSGGVDLRLANLTKRGAGKPRKAAREIAVKHAVLAARANAPVGFDITAYEANIWALFAAHDEAYGLATE